MNESLKDKNKEDYEEFKEVLQLICDYFGVEELEAISLIRYFITIKKRHAKIAIGTNGWEPNSYLVPDEKLVVIRAQMIKHKVKLNKLKMVEE